MKLIIAFITLFFVLLSQAYSAKSLQTEWSLEQKTNKMTDRTECSLNAPSKEIMLSIQNDGMYFVVSKPFSTMSGMALITMRVDKNKAEDLLLRTSNIRIGAVVDENKLKGMIEQMKNGKLLLLETVTAGVTVEDQVDLQKFTSALAKYEACMGR